MLTEKNDLRNLFRSVCETHHVATTNGKGWADFNSRAAMVLRFQKHELEGRQRVLLYCGDHNPDGLRISSALRSNLAELETAVGWSPENLEVDRFGLNRDFIDKHNLTWISPLSTGHKEGIALNDKRHKNNKMAYVQNYINAHGERKVEANVIVAKWREGQELCLQTILKYVPEDAPEVYRKTLRPYIEEAKEELRNRVSPDAV